MSSEGFFTVIIKESIMEVYAKNLNIPRLVVVKVSSAKITEESNTIIKTIILR